MINTYKYYYPHLYVIYLNIDCQIYRLASPIQSRSIWNLHESALPLLRRRSCGHVADTRRGGCAALMAAVERM